MQKFGLPLPAFETLKPILASLRAKSQWESASPARTLYSALQRGQGEVFSSLVYTYIYADERTAAF
jgi:hypothetical protein